MTLTKWKPMTDLLSIHGEMNRLFDDFFTPRPLHRRLLEDVWHPSVDVAENADGIIITAELPGMTEDDVDISIIDSVLTLGGEKKQEKEIKEDSYHRIERSYGKFQRFFNLPTSIKSGDVKATFKDGILTINIPKTEEAKPKKIEINTE